MDRAAALTVSGFNTICESPAQVPKPEFCLVSSSHSWATSLKSSSSWIHLHPWYRYWKPPGCHPVRGALGDLAQQGCWTRRSLSFWEAPGLDFCSVGGHCFSSSKPFPQHKHDRSCSRSLPHTQSCLCRTEEGAPAFPQASSAAFEGAVEAWWLPRVASMQEALPLAAAIPQWPPNGGASPCAGGIAQGFLLLIWTTDEASFWMWLLTSFLAIAQAVPEAGSWGKTSYNSTPIPALLCGS